MAHSLVLSDEAYSRLSAKAKAAGFVSVEAYLESHFSPHNDVPGLDSMRRVRAIRERVATECGPLPESVALIREDRER